MLLGLRMSSAWIAVIGTLGGVSLTALSGFMLQRQRDRRDLRTRWDTIRRDSYANFLVATRRTHSALDEVIYHASGESRDTGTDEPWRRAHEHLAEATAAYESLSVVGTDQVANTAEALLAYLTEMEDDVHGYTRRDASRGTPPNREHYAHCFSQRRKALLDAVREQLGIDVTASRRLAALLRRVRRRGTV